MADFIMCILLTIIFYCALFFFTDKSCLPYKRKMENMLRVIKLYQANNNIREVNFSYKGRTFELDVCYCEVNYLYYGYYEVYINGNIVKRFHILSHLFSKSRCDEHCGRMLEIEENEIIKAAYKYVTKANKEHFNDEWKNSSYFS